MKKGRFIHRRIVFVGPISLTDERFRKLGSGQDSTHIRFDCLRWAVNSPRRTTRKGNFFLKKESFSLDIDHTLEYEVETRMNRDAENIMKKSRSSSMFWFEDCCETHQGEIQTIRGPCLLDFPEFVNCIK